MTLPMIGIQLLGLIPSVIAFTSLQTNNRKRILILQLFCCVMWGVHYGFLGAATAVMTNVIGLGRAGLCYFNNHDWAKSKIFLVLLVCLYLFTAYITWDGYISLLPCFSMILTTFALWTHDMKITRLLFALNSPPLIIYNIMTGSYSCTVIEILAFCSFLLAIYRFDIRGCKEKAAILSH